MTNEQTFLSGVGTKHVAVSPAASDSGFAPTVRESKLGSVLFKRAPRLPCCAVVVVAGLKDQFASALLAGEVRVSSSNYGTAAHGRTKRLIEQSRHRCGRAVA